MSAITNRRTNRIGLYALAGTLTLFILIPLYLITLAAFSPPDVIYSYPKSLLPTQLSTETMQFFLNSRSVLQSLWNSIVVGIGTLILALLIGAPAGYALARFLFPGRDTFKMTILTTRAFPIVILSIPLAVTFINWGLYDTLFGVMLAHTALALPITILVTSSIFAGVPRDLEEAAQTLGCSPLQAFLRVSLPLALPGLAAAALFTFVLSWNEVFAATILTLRNRTLPALLLSQLNTAPLPFRFAGGFFLVLPALIFIFMIRKYLLGMWGQIVK